MYGDQFVGISSKNHPNIIKGINLFNKTGKNKTSLIPLVRQSSLNKRIKYKLYFKGLKGT